MDHGLKRPTLLCLVAILCFITLLIGWTYSFIDVSFGLSPRFGIPLRKSSSLTENISQAITHLPETMILIDDMSLLPTSNNSQNSTNINNLHSSHNSTTSRANSTAILPLNLNDSAKYTPNNEDDKCLEISQEKPENLLISMNITNNSYYITNKIPLCAIYSLYHINNHNRFTIYKNSFLKYEYSRCKLFDNIDCKTSLKLKLFLLSKSKLKFYLFTNFSDQLFANISDYWSIWEHERFEYLKYHPSRVFNISNANIVIFPKHIEQLIVLHYPCYGQSFRSYLEPTLKSLDGIEYHNISFAYNFDDKMNNITLKNSSMSLKDIYKKIGYNYDGDNVTRRVKFFREIFESNNVDDIENISWKLRYQNKLEFKLHKKKVENYSKFQSKLQDFIAKTILNLSKQNPKLYYFIFSLSKKIQNTVYSLDKYNFIKNNLTNKFLFSSVFCPQSFESNKDICYPPPFVSSKERHNKLFIDSNKYCHPCRKNRKYNVTFYGTFLSHKIRENYMSKYDNIELDQIIVNSVRKIPHFIKRYGPDLIHMNYSYDDVMINSKYILCPRGTLSYSFRFRETIEIGNIGIMIADGYNLPFNDLINWNYYEKMNTLIRIKEYDFKKITNETIANNGTLDLIKLFVPKLNDKEMCKAFENAAKLRDEYFGRYYNEVNSLLLNIEKNIRYQNGGFV